MTRVTVLTLAMALCLASVVPTAAQTTGRLTGIVTDAQDATLPGVTVTATSPALIGSQTAITEVNGGYLFQSLPPGTYTLVFELPGFQTLRREGIVLALGQTLSVNTSMPLATLEESVTVTGEAPIVDVSSTAVGSEFSADELSTIPSATDLWSTLGQAPGVRMRGFDVGGSHKSQQVGYESFGIRDQNRVVTDGVDTTEGDGGAGFYQDFYAHEEVSVTAAGGDVQMMTPGSAVFSTIKSGGNEFSSLNNLTYEDGSFVGNNIDDETAERGFTGNPNKIFWEGHTDLGGPIKRDKLWFYVAYNHFKIDKTISGVDPQFSDLGIFDNFTTKGTWKASAKDTVIAYYQWGNKQKPRRGLSNTTPAESILAQDSFHWMYNGQWQRVWTNRFFTDIKVGLFGFEWPGTPAVDWTTNPPRIDTLTDIRQGAGWIPFTSGRNKPQVTATGSYFLPDTAGSHDIKFGFEWQDDQAFTGDNGKSGPLRYLDRGGQVDVIHMTDLGTAESYGTDWTGPDDRNGRFALFLQDRWSLNSKLSLSLGVRFDRQQPHFEESIRNPILTELFEAQTVPGQTLLTSTTVVPRIGISYSPTEDGRSVFKAFYGRYYFNFADRLDNMNPGGINTKNFEFLDQNGNRLYDGLHELGALLESSGGASTSLDPNLRTPYADEFSTSYERQFWGESSIRVAYVRKMKRDEFDTLDILREGQFTVPRTVTVDQQDFVNGVTSPVTLTVMDIPDSLVGQVQNTVTNISDSVGGGSANYDTVQFAFNKRFGSGLFIQSSFDYQWRDELRENNASTSPLTSDPIGVAYFQNVFPDVSNRQESTNWQARLLGRYTFPYEVGLGLNLRAQSGWAYARLFSVSLPNAGTQRFWSENIDNNRSDTVTIVDVRLDKAFTFGGRYRFTAMADLFNLLNTNAVSNFNIRNGSQFNRIIATLDPRTFMLGFRFDF